MRLRRVEVAGPDGEPLSLSYPGLLLTGYEDGREVCRRWVPLGRDPSFADDERLIEALHAATLWQNHESGDCS
ncbi:hypothetical protein [Amycolatopsis granulosa]|uniref:hypothetical protein n=1 Tax=Amycolatopsis granulosa TaxID=185684 RepID=UPI001FB9E599|nr:hypothetical protein [Amycolatopsis granulosa]NIH87568.1 hypothetical protein [Amycolatopsis granulosa]